MAIKQTKTTEKNQKTQTQKLKVEKSLSQRKEIKKVSAQSAKNNVTNKTTTQTRHMICIMCPMGCSLTVKVDGENVEVTGNGCNRGVVFAKEEVTCPKRIVTTSVKTEHGVRSCKTTAPIPKKLIFDCVKEVEKLRLKDVKYGDIIIKNVLGTGVDVVVTANC